MLYRDSSKFLTPIYFSTGFSLITHNYIKFQFLRKCALLPPLQGNDPSDNCDSFSNSVGHFYGTDVRM